MTKEKYRQTLGMGVIVFSFILFLVILFMDISQQKREIALYILGAANMYCGLILNFEFGSSSGSKTMTDTMTEMIKRKDNPVTEKLEIDTVYRVNDSIFEDTVEYECILEYTTSQAVTPASLDPIHWKKK